MRHRLQRRTPLRLDVDRHRRPTPPPADPPQPDPEREGDPRSGVLPVLRPRAPPRNATDPDQGRRTPPARGRGLPNRQGRLRAGPFPGQNLPPAPTTPRAGHGRLGRGRRHPRPPPHNQQPHACTGQSTHASTGRSRADPTHRRRGETPGQPIHPQLAQHRTSPALVHLATTPPSPRPLAPPPSTPQTPMTRSQSRTAVLRSPPWSFTRKTFPACLPAGARETLPADQ